MQKIAKISNRPLNIGCDLMVVCSSCNKKSESYVKFKCPSCNETMYRCEHCRALSNAFKCKNCGLELP